MGFGILVRDLCDDLAPFEKIVFEKNCMGSFPGHGAFGQRMRGVSPVPSFPSLSPAQVHVNCGGPSPDGGGVSSLSSFRGKLKTFCPQAPKPFPCSVLGLQHQGTPDPALKVSQSSSPCRGGIHLVQGFKAQARSQSPASESLLYHLVGSNQAKCWISLCFTSLPVE